LKFEISKGSGIERVCFFDSIPIYSHLLRDENRRRAADPALKGWAKVISPLRGGGAAAREFLIWRATGESETHRTAGGKATRTRSGIYSHVLRDDRRYAEIGKAEPFRTAGCVAVRPLAEHVDRLEFNSITGVAIASPTGAEGRRAGSAGGPAVRPHRATAAPTRAGQAGQINARPVRRWARRCKRCAGRSGRSSGSQVESPILWPRKYSERSAEGSDRLPGTRCSGPGP